jgi:hypothetical protein
MVVGVVVGSVFALVVRRDVVFFMVEVLSVLVNVVMDRG